MHGFVFGGSGEKAPSTLQGPVFSCDAQSVRKAVVEAEKPTCTAEQSWCPMRLSGVK